eukprot:1150034-Pelagomonas_calceolata.AAC.7
MHEEALGVCAPALPGCLKDTHAAATGAAHVCCFGPGALTTQCLSPSCKWGSADLFECIAASQNHNACFPRLANMRYPLRLQYMWSTAVHAFVTLPWPAQANEWAAGQLAGCLRYFLAYCTSGFRWLIPPGLTLVASWRASCDSKNRGGLLLVRVVV